MNEGGPTPMPRRAAAWVPWSAAVLALVSASILTIGRSSGQPATIEQRAEQIASGLRCPVCQNLSVADSDSGLALEMRADIARRLREGQNADEVRRYFVDRYGSWILLRPPMAGLGMLLWLVPATLAIGGLAFLLRMRRRIHGSISGEQNPATVRGTP